MVRQRAVFEFEKYKEKVIEAILGAFANILQSFEDAVKALEGDRIQ
ncbi:hypothetical protein S40285_09750 [Stachybotrys chlorohalonatus IBT 40285]|uniref:Uncharacterized protein n=1 Tax=Stachybotrys chlorohalonatus (strain IBT 40285) TaxID=1283841 RepID=A0A084QUG8_STAC4|nr:hypothetical protein S40285_09750 [Stachybotrys chlorohalonata IBT 40285]